MPSIEPRRRSFGRSALVLLCGACALGAAVPTQSHFGGDSPVDDVLRRDSITIIAPYTSDAPSLVVSASDSVISGSTPSHVQTEVPTASSSIGLPPIAAETTPPREGSEPGPAANELYATEVMCGCILALGILTAAFLGWMEVRGRTRMTRIEELLHERIAIWAGPSLSLSPSAQMSAIEPCAAKEGDSVGHCSSRLERYGDSRGRQERERSVLEVDKGSGPGCSSGYGWTGGELSPTTPTSTQLSPFSPAWGASTNTLVHLPVTTAMAGSQAGDGRSLKPARSTPMLRAKIPSIRE